MKSISPPILVTGCPRSGTSLIAGILNVCGCFFGKVDRMMENIKIREKIIKPYFLYDLRTDASGYNDFPITEKVFEYLEQVDFNLRGRIKGVLLEQGWDWGCWGYKDSRTLLSWPLWVDVFPEALWVVVCRDEKEVLYSCEKTVYVRGSIVSGINGQLGGDNWLQAVKMMYAGYLQKISELKSNNHVKVIEIWPNKIVNNQDYTYIKKVVDVAGLSWNLEAVQNFINPKIWKNHEN